MRTYAVIYDVGRGWKMGKPIEEQALEDHYQFLQYLFQQGILIEGGPYLDDSGGLALIRAEDIDAAWELVEQDPAVINEVFVPEIHPWFQGNWEGQ
ncbi:MAG: hypothetical protein GC179_15410 [Anaerolineaceae bacterium]|nr:hypothetical protein [Anaerolineaceae bacterium]